MGNQPDEQIIAVIGRHCPIKAAKAYLTHYAKNERNGWDSASFDRPVPKSIAKEIP